MFNVLEYLEKAANEYPQKIAVSDKENSWSFSTLMHDARRLGAQLNACGVNGGMVGVFVDRGADALVMLLGVLYAGACYIPLDPDIKEKKFKAIVEDSEISALVGREIHRKEAGTIHFLSLDDLPETEAPIPACGGNDPLYMIYTSGSTGKPKGVLKSHAAMINFVETFSSTFGISEEDIIGNQTPFFFDASAKDIYLMLCVGATLEILPTELFSFPVLLIRYLNERKVSYICWVPTALAIVTQLNTFMEVVPETLRKVFFVGEVFPIKQLRRWREALPEVQFVNLYGSTELAGICCFYEIHEEIQDVLPMGKPLPNCKVFLWSDNGKVISSADTIGEVCISSPALALEYYHDPEKTAKQFVYTELNGDTIRIFRSGDLAHYDKDGNLVFSCRSDFQIKHMGRRIELGEIEAATDSLLGIDRCCCLYNEKKHCLTLFYTGNIDSRQLKRELRQRLSDYMVPTKVIFLDTMPTNANGKIDRVKLKSML